MFSSLVTDYPCVETMGKCRASSARASSSSRTVAEWMFSARWARVRVPGMSRTPSSRRTGLVTIASRGQPMGKNGTQPAEPGSVDRAQIRP